MSAKKYKLSFTAASLTLSESIKIASTYLESHNWDETKRVIEDKNLLQSRTRSRTVRTYRELAQRLQLLSTEQLELLTNANLQEQKYLLWYAICKRYTFIQEFAFEVIREKYLTMDYELRELDYVAFFDRKADWHPELDELKISTKGKIKQVLFRMLREAGIVTDNNQIMRAVLSARLVRVLRTDAPQSYLVFPILESDIECSSR